MAPFEHTLRDLLTQRARTRAEIRRMSLQPMSIQAQFSDALNARLATLETLITAAQAAKRAELPERLQRLDREMAIERVTDFQIVYAVRDEHRIKCEVFRCGASFRATSRVGGHLFVFNGALPSDAFLALIRSIKRVANQMDLQKGVAMSAALRQEA